MEVSLNYVYFVNVFMSDFLLSRVERCTGFTILLISCILHHFLRLSVDLFVYHRSEFITKWWDKCPCIVLCIFMFNVRNLYFLIEYFTSYIVIMWCFHHYFLQEFLSTFFLNSIKYLLCMFTTIKVMYTVIQKVICFILD